jgi:hypothetical protein
MRLRQILGPAPSITRWVTVISGALVVMRFVVLFCEAFSVVRSERLADEDLIELCSRGAAADSVKFRTLCLQAKADRAAPIFLKAVLRAIRTAFADFTESFNSPAKIAILLLFVLSGLALPVVKAVSALATAHLSPVADAVHGYGLPAEGDQEACEVVVLNGGGRKPWLDRLRPLRGRGRVRHLTLRSGFDDDENDDENGRHTALWEPVQLGRMPSKQD